MEGKKRKFQAAGKVTLALVSIGAVVGLHEYGNTDEDCHPDKLDRSSTYFKSLLRGHQYCGNDDLNDTAFQFGGWSESGVSEMVAVGAVLSIVLITTAFLLRRRQAVHA